MEGFDMNEKDLITSGDERLDQQLRFSAEIDKMTSVFRRTMLLDKSRRENDAEHSWHIAVMAMLFSEYAKESVDIGHVVQMCLVHDLVEIIAGDTFAYDAKGSVGKDEREKNAADIIFSILPKDQGKELRKLWEEFEAMETADAKYAACMDRLQPFFHNMLTDGHTWVEGKSDRAMVERRMAVIKDFMPEVYSWMDKNMDVAIEKGWLDAGV